MLDEYDEFGEYQPKPKTSLVYWAGWGVLASSMVAAAVECIDRGRNLLGVMLLVSALMSFVGFYRYRRQEHLEIKD